jgi:hypothetical protein
MFMALSRRDKTDLVNSYLNDIQEHIGEVAKSFDTDTLDNLIRIVRHSGHELVEG